MLDVKKLFTKILEAIKPLRWEIITSGTANMNDYKTEGRYYFSQGVTLSNTPNGAVNGWLQVLPSNGTIVKQIWYRHGSANGSPPTYTDFYERVYSGSSWFAWERITTASELAGYVPTSRTVNGHALTGNISVVPSDLNLDFGSDIATVGYYLTAANYPYIRLTDTSGNLYQIVITATGLRYETRASGGSWVTKWTK